MQLKRLFSTDHVKGTRNYLNTQKKYEILRTVLYFSISLSLFAAGYIQTGSRGNLLSIVAVLGCLPASKSAVGAIMFFRFQSCPEQAAAEIEQHVRGLATVSMIWCLLPIRKISWSATWLSAEIPSAAFPRTRNLRKMNFTGT